MIGPELFLSYSAADRQLVMDVQKLLEGRGITTFLDRNNLAIGLPWPQALEEGLRRVRGVAIFIGRELGGWQKREMWFTLDRQVSEEKQGRAFPVIPVLLPGADVTPGFLFSNTWIDLRDGLDARGVGEALHAFERALNGAHHGQAPERTASICPYRGLQVFREEDAAFFFGRKTFAKQLLDYTLAKDLVAVVGPSGSGKSSVVQAGLLPLLRRERPPANTWDQVTFSPGTDPYGRLALSLSPLLEQAVDNEMERLVNAKRLGDYLATGQVTLAAVVERVLQKSNGTCRLLVIADQFEELFTLTPEPVRRAFAELLLRDLGRAPFTLLITLRADFYSHIITLQRELSDRLATAQVNIGALTREELRESITVPATLVGLRFEPGLVERILTDMGSEPGRLPLVEFALAELWHRRDGRLISNNAYDQIGGITGALTQRAEDVFGRLTAHEQSVARGLLSRLVRVARPEEAGEDTRQRTELTAGDTVARRVVNRLADARLLVTSDHSTEGLLSVEVAHEALIRNWDRLRVWLNEDREFLLWRQRLQLQVEEWQLHQNDPSYLLRGTPLSEAERWLLERSTDLTEAEQQLIRRSLVLQQQERAEHEERRQVDIANARRLAEAAEARAHAADSLARSRRKQLVVTVAAAILVVAVGGIAVYQRAETVRTRIEALAPQLLNHSDFLLRYEPSKNDVAALLAIQAMRMRPNANAAQLLGNALSLLPMHLVFQAAAFNQRSVAFSSDDRYVAVASADGATELRNVDTGATTRLLEGRPNTRLRNTLAITTKAGAPEVAFVVVSKKGAEPEKGAPSALQAAALGGFARIQVFEDNDFPLAFHPKSGVLATTQGDAVVRVWSLDDLQIKFRLQHKEPISSVLFSPRGESLATISGAPTGAATLTLWELKSWQPDLEIEVGEPVSAIRFSPDGNTLAVGTFAGHLSLINIRSGKPLPVKTQGSILSVAFSPNGDLVAAADMKGFVNVFRVSDGRPELSIQHPGYVNAVAFTVNGSEVATAGFDGAIRFINLTTRQVSDQMMRHESEITSLEFSHDGRKLISCSLDYSCRVWDTFSARETVRMSHETHTGFSVLSHTTRYVATTDAKPQIRVWDIGSPAELPWSSHANNGQVYMSPDWSAHVVVRESEDKHLSADVYDSSGRKASIPFTARKESLDDVWVTAKGSVLVTLRAGTAYVWNVITGTLWDAVLAKSSVAVSAGGKYVATDSDGESTCVLKVGGSKEPECVKDGGSVTSFRFSDDERLLLSLGRQKATVRDPATGKALQTFTRDSLGLDEFASGSLGPDGRLLAIASGNTVTLAEATGGKKLRSLIHDFNVHHVVFSPSGRYLASESGDPFKNISITRVWDVETGEEINRTNSGSGDRRMLFSPDDLQLLAQGTTSPQIWSWKPDKLIEQACARLHRNLTRGEWNRYVGDVQPSKTCPNLP